MCAAESRNAATDATGDGNGFVSIPETPTGARRKRAARPDVAAEPDALHGSHEAARTQAHLARAKKAAVLADRLAVGAAEGEERPHDSSRSLPQRAAVLLSVLATITGTDVRISGTPTALHAEIRLGAALSETEHKNLLEALSLADQFGHSITRQDGEKVWASYRSIPRSGRQPHEAGPPPPPATLRPAQDTESAAFYTTRERSRGGEFHPPV
ncbi:hypothetical protein [Streptomyces californicus]|uniref:hypothetical protein n=1 Tax=Streptomyces californicus TaxID=67351 RepID=UPI0037A24F7D